MMELAARAKTIAAIAHRNQKRKYTGQAYITHPVAVAEMVQAAGGTEAMIIAAYLHDTVEDTNMTIQKIADEFGYKIAYYVACLTNITEKDDAPRKERKMAELWHLRAAPPEVKTIKLADLIHNAESIFEYAPPDFADMYANEMSQLLEVLTEGDAGLYEKAEQILLSYFNDTNLLIMSEAEDGMRHET